MNEKNPRFSPDTAPIKGHGETPENTAIHKPATPEEMAMLECFLNDHPEAGTRKETRRDCEKEKGELEQLLNKFEKDHSLEKLNAILDVSPELFYLLANDLKLSAEEFKSTLANLTPEDTEKYWTRAPARQDLKPIVTLLGTLEKETNISEPDFNKLKLTYKILSQAVGMINNNKVDHTR